MKRLFKGFILIILVAILTTVPTQYANATTDDFNWVQWYEGNGMGTVIGYIMNGSMTTEEACLKIIIPASEAGKVEQSHVEYFIELYPEAKGLLEVYGVITGTTPTVTPEPTPVIPAYTIEDCDMYKYATTDVNVRTEPDTNAGRVGSVPQNAQVHVTGKTSNGWYRIEYNGVNGFSVAKYFADKPIEVIENVTDTPEPTEAPVATEEPVVEPTAEPTVEPTATPESTTRTEITQQATPAPVVEPTATPVPTEAPAENKVSTVAYIGIGVIVVVAVTAIAVIVAKRKKKE